MRRHDPFSSAYVAIRERLRTGELAPGEMVSPVAEAARLGVSVTPVREALACLSGEGLVSRAIRGGYDARRLTPDQVARRLHLLATLLRRGPETGPPPKDAEDWLGELPTLAMHDEALAGVVGRLVGELQPFVRDSPSLHGPVADERFLSRSDVTRRLDEAADAVLAAAGWSSRATGVGPAEHAGDPGATLRDDDRDHGVR